MTIDLRLSGVGQKNFGCYQRAFIFEDPMDRDITDLPMVHTCHRNIRDERPIKTGSKPLTEPILTGHFVGG